MQPCAWWSGNHGCLTFLPPPICAYSFVSDDGIDIGDMDFTYGGNDCALAW